VLDRASGEVSLIGLFPNASIDSRSEPRRGRQQN
jgi:hypothetical protein